MQADRGRFVTFEGPEGSGKSTQVRRLIDLLIDRGVPVLSVREPGGTPTGEAIRDILQHDRAGEPIAPEAEALLFAASRAQLVQTRILPALQAGDWVVCDRFADSTTAYQGYGRGFGVEAMERINAFAINGAEPDLTILLDLPVDRALARLAARQRDTGKGPDRIEREEQAFHEAVRQGYLDLAQRHHQRFYRVDADREVETIGHDIQERIEQLLDQG